MKRQSAVADWERLWAPYDEDTYRAVLRHVGPDDVVLDIGAGDLRLSRQMAVRAERVYALELNRQLLPSTDVPVNLTVLVGDAYAVPVPPRLTLAVLLMRHCRRFGRLLDKLVAAGCRRLVTNARWGVGVELIDLQAPRQPYDAVYMGWYGCRCGAVGFVPGPAERLTVELEAVVTEVAHCPACQP